MNSRLAGCRYGKDNIRLFKVIRDDKTDVQTVVETTVTCLIDGEIEESYADRLVPQYKYP